MGLVDEVAEDAAESVAKCKSYLLQYKDLVPSAVAETKLRCRKETIDKFINGGRQADMKAFVKMVTDQRFQASLKIYLDALKKKSK